MYDRSKAEELHEEFGPMHEEFGEMHKREKYETKVGKNPWKFEDSRKGREERITL